MYIYIYIYIYIHKHACACIRVSKTSPLPYSGALASPRPFDFRSQWDPRISMAVRAHELHPESAYKPYPIWQSLLLCVLKTLNCAYIVYLHCAFALSFVDVKLQIILHNTNTLCSLSNCVCAVHLLCVFGHSHPYCAFWCNELCIVIVYENLCLGSITYIVLSGTMNCVVALCCYIVCCGTTI